MGAGINLAIVGPGLVGKALLAQLQKQDARLRELGIVFRTAGLCNSSRMVFFEAAERWNAKDYHEILQSHGEPADLEGFRRTLCKNNNTVLVDCTASDAVPKNYLDWISANAHIVTPNKRLGAGQLEDYCALFKECRAKGGKFFYEATVGAGLPVISTLQGLLNTGDRIKKIEGVFSGTLSYIFNSFGVERSFSSVVKVAKQEGYTEPDPRDDLSGVDVARKVVILARECGMQVELSDVQVESLVPKPLQNAESLESFLADLPQYDEEMSRRAAQAEAHSRKLCYVGSIDLQEKTCTVSLQAFPQDHPFAQLSGSDNIISFTTERYSKQPLIVRGPGAGAEVTAAGVFSDLILLSRSLGA